MVSFILDRLSKGFFDKIFNAAKEKALEKLKKINTARSNRYEVLTGDIQDSVRLHITSVAKIAENFHLKGMERPKAIKDIYIDLNIRLSARKWDYRKRNRRVYDITKLLASESNHLIILGDPGAGKSTTIKRICSLLIFEDLKTLGHLRFPLLIRLRELKDDESLFDRLRAILSVSIASYVKKPEKEDPVEKMALIKNFILEYLDLLGIVLLLDGFDEILDSKAVKILNEIQELTTALINSKVVITSRSGSFDKAIDCTSIYEIQPLASEQVEAFLRKWFKSEVKAKKFKQQLTSSPHYSNTVKPLDLVLLCTLFDNNGFIPDQPKDVYRKRIKLYIEEWDKENNVKRNSKYSQLDVDSKFYFLSQLSFWLSFENNKRVYGEEELRSAYIKIHEYFNLPKNETKKVTQELETHTGLIVTSGYEKMEFYHKTIQEYFTAYYLHELPSIPLISNFPDEFAIATSLCPDSNSYFIKLLLSYISGTTLNRDFLKRFLYRLTVENVRFKSTNLQIATLLLSYEFIFINTEGGYHKHESEERELTRKGQSTTTNTIKMFFAKYLNRKAAKEFLDHYTIEGAEYKRLNILSPKGKYILSTITDLYKEHHNLLHKRIYVTDDLLLEIKRLSREK